MHYQTMKITKLGCWFENNERYERYDCKTARWKQK